MLNTDSTGQSASRSTLDLDTGGSRVLRTAPERLDWFQQLPDEMHEEQKAFLRSHGLAP